MSNTPTRTMAVRLPVPVKRALHSYAHKTEQDVSRILKQAIYTHVDRLEDIELHPTVEKTLESMDYYNEYYAEQFFIDKENEVVSTQIKEHTYIDYMDNFLARIFLSNKPYYTDKELKNLMRDAMKVLERRAEHHGVLKRYKARHEEPIKYAEMYLDRKTTEGKTLKDIEHLM